MLTQLLIALAVASGSAAPSSECVSTDDQAWQGETLVCEVWELQEACGQVVAHCPNVGDDTHDSSSFDQFVLLPNGTVRVWY